MSSSSTPDGPEPVPQLDLGDIETAEQEVEAEHERALGVQRGRQKQDRGWITFAWGFPGFAWLAFYLIAPLIFIVLMSFWTPDSARGLAPSFRRRSDVLLRTTREL